MVKSFDLAEDSIVDVVINNVKGEPLHTISLDISDPDAPNRFAQMIANIEAISSEVERKDKELKKKYENVTEYNHDKVVDTCRLHIESLKQICSEIDFAFGEGTIEGVYSEHLVLNPDYIPDEYALMDFLDKMIPIVNDTYHTRFELNKKKYNINRRGGKGRHNYTKEELIQRQMGK